MGHYAPQLAYNNPHIPFTFTRLGKAPVIKSASAEGEELAAKAETTANADAEVVKTDEASSEPTMQKGELASSSLILSLSASAVRRDGQADEQKTGRQERSRRRMLVWTRSWLNCSTLSMSRADRRSMRRRSCQRWRRRARTRARSRRRLEPARLPAVDGHVED